MTQNNNYVGLEILCFLFPESIANNTRIILAGRKRNGNLFCSVKNNFPKRFHYHFTCFFKLFTFFTYTDIQMYLLLRTDYVVQSPREAISHSAIREIPRLV
jgi:hypothetical protein